MKTSKPLWDKAPSVRDWSLTLIVHQLIKDDRLRLDVAHRSLNENVIYDCSFLVDTPVHTHVLGEFKDVVDGMLTGYIVHRWGLQDRLEL